MNLFSKVRTIALSNLHTVLDRAINLNSVGAVEQHVRDLEAARQDLEGTLAEARYDLRTKRSNLSTHETHAEKLTADIRTLMGANGGETSEQNKAAARQLAGQLATLRETIATDDSTCHDSAEVEMKLTQAVAAINAKETEMKQRVGTLRAQASSTQAKNRAANALESVGNALEAGGSIDNVADKVGRENARADAKFDRALGAVPADPTTGAKADAILAELTGR